MGIAKVDITSIKRFLNSIQFFERRELFLFAYLKKINDIKQLINRFRTKLNDINVQINNKRPIIETYIVKVSGQILEVEKQINTIQHCGDMSEDELKIQLIKELEQQRKSLLGQREKLKERMGLAHELKDEISDRLKKFNKTSNFLQNTEMQLLQIQSRTEAICGVLRSYYQKAEEQIRSAEKTIQKYLAIMPHIYPIPATSQVDWNDYSSHIYRRSAENYNNFQPARNALDNWFSFYYNEITEEHLKTRHLIKDHVPISSANGEDIYGKKSKFNDDIGFDELSKITKKSIMFIPISIYAIYA